MGWRPSGKYTPAAKRVKLGSWEVMIMGRPRRVAPTKYVGAGLCARPVTGGNNYFPDPIVLFHYSNIPLFHYSCLEYAGWVLEIPYYQQFVEFPRHYNRVR